MPTTSTEPALDISFRLGAEPQEVVGVRVNGRSLPAEVLAINFNHLAGRAPLISMTVRISESGDKPFAARLVEELESMGVRVTVNID